MSREFENTTMARFDGSGVASRRRSWVLALGLLAFVVGCVDAGRLSAPDPEFLSSDATRALGLPFSDAVRVGGVLYLSGQIGNLPGTLDLAPGGIVGQARQTLQNIRSILERNGSSLDRVVKCTVFLADITEWAAFNEVYVEFFPKDPPARSAFGASGLGLGARVEVECIAVAGQTP